ncbi:MAG: thioredoxin family protein [Candidatus Methanomethylophilaceae archaeon]|nr:thioredoxin family protein [Candidatus Methanomethylophilaceae archaeon]
MFGSRKREVEPVETGAFVKVLGSGCRNCETTAASMVTALRRCGLPDAVAHVTDLEDIVSYGVMVMPAVVFGREVVSVGRTLTADQAVELVGKHRGMFQ